MKIKENIKKIGNRKNCLLLALLILALLFTVLMPKINIGTQKASALSAPQAKTLDLNGQSYSYQTSLNELKNNYGFFNYHIDNDLLTLHTDEEGVNYATVLSSGGIVSEENRPVLSNLLKENIKLYNNNKIYEDNFIYDTQNSTDHPAYNWGEETNDFNLTRITNININIPELLKTPLVENLTLFSKGCNISLYYLKNEMPEKPWTNEIVLNNTIVKNYFFTKALNYNFIVNNINGYSLRSIYISFEGNILNKTNLIYCANFYNNWPSYDNYDSYTAGYITIKNLNFIDSPNSNILEYEFSSWDYPGTQDGIEIYQGSLLLSENKWDTALFDLLKQNSSGFNIKQSFKGKVYFGRNETQSTNFGYMNTSGAVTSLVVDFINGFDDKHPPQYLNNSDPLFIYSSTNNKISYLNQNQLLFVDEAQGLTIEAMTGQTYTGAGLSAQVEDILYSVEYLGETEKIQQEQEIQKDFENMLYVTGAFAVIGLLLGFVFGNPVLGLVIGAIVGFGLTIIPIILDGLQAIFGQQFLDGLQNFFRSIASAIAGVVSTILNFLFSIITNPAVLVLVLIVAILYLFVFRKK